MNFCVIFLFLNFLAGVFIFVILGIFVLTDSPFLIQMNLKTIEGKIERYDAQGKKNAYIQYFISAGLNLLYALLAWFLPKIISRRKKNQIPEKLNELQIIDGDDDLIKLNTDINQDNNMKENENNENEINTSNTNEQIASINTITSIKSEKDIGMSEKIEF